MQVKVVSPKHRLIKVDSQEFGRCANPLSPVTVQEEPVGRQNLTSSVPFAHLLHLINLLCLWLSASVSHSLVSLSGLQVIPSAPAAGDQDTDYSDPFDARPDPRTRTDWEPSTAPDSRSYMEPFQAQRIISG